MKKEELRKIFLQKRKALSEAEHLQLNRQLCDIFFAHVDISFVKSLHTFLPIKKNNEPDTWLLIDRIRREYPHIRLVIPKVNQQTGEMENYYYEGMHQLVQNTWGIDEPKQGVPVDATRIDMVLVPLLAVDVSGHRVGYGRGFYDRFLNVCRPDVKTIGISLFEPVENIEDINSQDIPVMYTLTPQGLRYHPRA